MKVIFSNTIFFLQKTGGISRYFVNLSRELNKINVKSKIIAPISKNVYLKNLNKKNIYLYFKRYPNNFFLKKINQIIFFFFLKIENPDIIHETYYNPNNLLILDNKINILTIYDLVHEKFSRFYSQDKFLEKKKVLEYVDHFICISKKTQSDFIKRYNIPKKKTSVIYLGGDHLNKKVKLFNIKLPDKFFLYVGSREGYKNFKILAKAVNSEKKLENINIVCFGGGEFSQLEISKLRLSFNFIYFQGDDCLLSYLYSKALAFINTSKYEGFGIPNVEAMHLGCPVISSDFDSLKEIGGKACLYFKNNNYLDLARVMKKIHQKSKLREIFIKRGYQRSKLYTWVNCARQTSSLYKSLL